MSHLRLDNKKYELVTGTNIERLQSTPTSDDAHMIFLEGYMLGEVVEENMSQIQHFSFPAATLTRRAPVTSRRGGVRLATSPLACRRCFGSQSASRSTRKTSNSANQSRRFTALSLVVWCGPFFVCCSDAAAKIREQTRQNVHLMPPKNEVDV